MHSLSSLTKLPSENFLLTSNNYNAIMLARATKLLKSFVALFYSAEFQKQTRGETIMSMTPMNNFDYLERVKFSEELAEIEAAKKASGMTYEAMSLS